MLNKKRSAGRARLRLLYVLPLTGGMLCASTLGFAKDYAFVDLYASKTLLISALAHQEPKQQPNKATISEKKKTYPIESVYDTEKGNNRPVKLIVINGKISRAVNFASVNNYDQVKELNSDEAVAKYGKRANKGALEFIGKNAGISITFPPPMPVKTTPPLARKNKNKVVKFPPPLNEKGYKKEVIKFPPPIVKPMKKYEDSTKGGANTAKLDVGSNPLYIINGNITVVNPGPGRIAKFTAKSMIVHPKNDDATIKKFGEAARDGVIELQDGEVFYADPDSVKKD